VLSLVVTMSGMYGAWKVRKGLMVRRALAEGRAAFERGDWETARLQLGRYLSVKQDDADVLAQYARAQLAARPLRSENLAQAMSAYRRMLALRPADEEVFRRLALLYENTGTLGELGYIARKRLEVLPDDPAATVALAKELVFLEKLDAARAALEGLVNRLEGQAGNCREYVEACVLLANLTAAGATSETGLEPVVWLDRAVERCPDSGWALAHRAARRQMVAAARAEISDHETAVREDLERAERLAYLEPPVQLLLSEQWVQLGEYERAAAQLDAAEKAQWAELEAHFVDPAEWTAALFIQRAKLALLRGEVDSGVALAEKTLEQLREHPQRSAVIPVAIELLAAGKRTKEARVWLEDYVDQLKLRGAGGTADEQLAWLRAVIARAENRPHEVAAQLAPLVDLSGARPIIRLLLAEAYMQTGQNGRAAQLLERAPADVTGNPVLARMIARMHMARGNWAQALNALQVAARAGDDPELKILRLAAQLGGAYGRDGAEHEVEQLAAELQALRGTQPDNVTVRLLLATIAEQREGWEAAAGELTRAIEECGQPLAAYRALARLYAEKGLTAKARETLEQACERHAKEAAPWLDLSELLADDRQFDEACAVLRRGLERADSSAKAELQRRLGLVYLLGGRREAGITTLKELAAANPEDCQTRALLLELPEINGDEAAAAELIEELKRAEGAIGITWRLHEARLWLARRDWRERQAQIEAHLKYCLDADGTLTAPVLLLGKMYEDLADWSAAEATYRAAFNRTGSVEVADRLLELFRRQQRFAEGRELLERMRQTLSAAALSARRIVLDIGEQRYDSALRELQLRTAGTQRDPMDFVRLAWVSYAVDRNAQRALQYLEQATAAGATPIDVARVRAAILRDQGRHAELAAVLDALVADHPTSEAFLLRASYRQSLGQTDLAEQDYAEVAKLADNDHGVAVLGEFYAQEGDLDRAIETWEAGLGRYPDSLTLRRGLAKAYLTRKRSGDAERAAALLNELERALPDDTDILWVRTVAAIQSGTLEARAQAREFLTQAVRSPPARAEVYRGLCELAFRLGEAQLARDLARRGLQANPADTRLMLIEARAALLLDDVDAARDRASALLAADPANVAALEITLEVALRKQDAAAIRQNLIRLNERAAADPANDWVQVLRARARVGLGEEAEARAELAAFCETDAGRQSLSALLTLQDLHRMQGDLAAAERTLDAAAALAGEHPAVVRSRALLLAAEGRYDSIVELARSARVEARDADVLVSIAYTLAASQAHLDQAVELCKRACELAPQNVNGFLALGELEYQRGNRAASRDAYEAALKLQPNHPAALNNLAWVLVESGLDLDAALAAARRAVALQPRDANFRDTLAFVLQRLGRLDEARTEYRRSVDLTSPASPERARLLLRLARVCAELDDWALVLDSLTEALAAGGPETFGADERAEIDRLLSVARQRQ